MEDIRKHTSLIQLRNQFFYVFGIVPLEYYGVVGDGITDNRLQLQQAINDAIVNNIKYIFVPKGEFYYSNSLRDADQIIWIGNSVEAYIEGIDIRQFPDLWNESQAAVAGILPIGSVILYAGTTIPDGFLACDGSTLNREDYSSLFDIIGTPEEKADPTGTTFVLPTATSTIARLQYIIRAR